MTHGEGGICPQDESHLIHEDIVEALTDIYNAMGEGRAESLDVKYVTLRHVIDVLESGMSPDQAFFSRRSKDFTGDKYAKTSYVVTENAVGLS